MKRNLRLGTLAAALLLTIYSQYHSPRNATAAPGYTNCRCSPTTQYLACEALGSSCTDAQNNISSDACWSQAATNCPLHGICNWALAGTSGCYQVNTTTWRAYKGINYWCNICDPYPPEV